MAHPLEGLVTEIKGQIKRYNSVNIVIDKDTINNMRKSMIKKSIEAGGIDRKFKDPGHSYSIKEDSNWIRIFVNRKITDHKLKFITGGTEIHIVTDAE